MNTTIATTFCFLALVISGCAGSPNTKPPAADMDAQYRILVEKDKIIEVINRLFIGTDNRDWSQVKNCFSSEVLFDMTSIGGGEPVTLTSQQIVDTWEKGLKPLKAIHHQTGNFEVDIKEGGADVFCYGTAYHYLPNKTNRNTRTFVEVIIFTLHLGREIGKSTCSSLT